MLVLTFANLKGGSGKTTLATNVAAALHADGHKTLIVDCDTQGSASAWATRAAELGQDGPPCVALTGGGAIVRDLRRLAASYDVAIVDGPARLSAETRAAVLAADLVAVPVTPGASDVWAAAEMVRVLDDAKALRPELRAVLVMNRVDRTGLARAAEKAVASAFGWPLCDVSVGHRVAFGEAMLAGRGVVQTAPESAAAHEVRRLVKALLRAASAESEAAA